MYYFAYIDENNICQDTYAMPTDLSGVAGYVPITEEQHNTKSVVGMRWNASTSTWEEVVEYYYAIVDANDVCINLAHPDAEVIDDTYIAISEEQYTNQTLIGWWYNRETQTWHAEAPFAAMAAHSTDEINVGASNECLTARLGNTYTKTQVDDLIAGVSGGTGSGTPGTDGADGADGEDGGYYIPTVAADGTLSWTASKDGMPAVTSMNIKGADGAPGAQGIQGEQGVQGIQGIQGEPGADGQDGQDGADGTTVVVGTVTTGEPGTSAAVQGVLNAETNTLTLNFTIPRGAQGEQGEKGEQGEQGEKGDAGDAAAVDAYTKTQVDNLLNEKADTNHTHTGYAASNHTHSNYASSSHTHTGYASSSHTHSNYFPTSGGTITGETNFSGGLVRTKGTQTLYNSGSMITISSNNVQTMIAGSAIFSKVAISVSSDERLKENIADVDAQACIDFINAIDVKTFNYKDNETPCVGVIAQQLEKVSPELAKRLVTKDEDGMLGVKTSDLVFPLIVAVQSLSARVAELEK